MVYVPSFTIQGHPFMSVNIPYQGSVMGLCLSMEFPDGSI